MCSPHNLSELFERHFSDDSMLLSMGARMLRNDPAWLFRWAEGSATGFDATKLAIAHALELGEPLPTEALEWIVQYLRGKVNRPKAKSGRKSEYWFHALIWLAVGSLANDGMTATRNDESPATSACDAVANALAELGLEPTTFHGVKRIWLRYEKHKGATIEAT